MFRLTLGALLSLLIDPIYYRTVIVGSLHHGESMERALFHRIEQVNLFRLLLWALEEKNQLSQWRICLAHIDSNHQRSMAPATWAYVQQLVHPSTRSFGTASMTNVNLWIPSPAWLPLVGPNECSILETLSVARFSETRSTVSKVALFEQWSLLMKRLGTTTVPALCSDAKQLAVDYREAKMQVVPVLSRISSILLMISI